MNIRTLLETLAAAALACAPQIGLTRTGPPAEATPDVTSLRLAVASERMRPVAKRLPRVAFLAQAEVQSVTLSPDGRYLAWTRAVGERRAVWVRLLPDGAPRILLPRTDATELAWSRDSRWLFLPEARQLAVLSVDGQRGAGEVTALGGLTRRRFLWVDPSQPAAALVLERPAHAAGDTGRWRLLRVAIGDPPTLLHEDRRPIVDAAIGRDGALAWLLLAEDDAHVLYRGAKASTRQAALRCGEMRRCGLLGVSADGGLWLLSNVDGDRTGLLHLGPDGGIQRIHDDPRGEADVFEVGLDPIDGRPRFVGYRSTVATLIALEPDDARRMAAIHEQRPGRALGITPGIERWLVRERGDTVRGERWWLADAAGTLTEVLTDATFVAHGKPVARPDESAMARKWPMRWQASDGRLIHGFVTLPLGIDVASAPLVVSVHGGPFSLVRPDFSNDAQLLANRGYVVFQPNFRGSTGHGRDYVMASGGDFGNGRVQRDIVEGTRWLLANGIGDASRVGIIGASFGGYAALLGVTFEPDLFKVAVAGVPPVDFGWVVREYLGAGQEMLPGIPMAASMRHLGLDPTDQTLARRLTAQSPGSNATLLRRPVLIVAGGQDERVPIRGITDYAARLHLLGKDISLFVDADADHGIADEHSREAYYFLMETMLHRRLGGAVPDPPSSELRRHLDRHLRLRGADLADTVAGR
jgi:dipeptidyl aminopeptidase/acylaminoacyl peptidase